MDKALFFDYFKLDKTNYRLNSFYDNDCTIVMEKGAIIATDTHRINEGMWVVSGIGARRVN